jgi:OPA family sugar phosphate sensor protein UhpC-like MFS transporter
MPMSVLALICLAALMFFFEQLPAERWAIGLGFFAIGFLLYIPDSLVSGTAAIDFGTKKGASTAAGFINGCGSIGAIAGGTMPGWVEALVGESTSVWSYVFPALAGSLVVAALLLLPKWNRLPQTTEATSGS